MTKELLAIYAQDYEYTNGVYGFIKGYERKKEEIKKDISFCLAMLYIEESNQEHENTRIGEVINKLQELL